MAAFRGKRQLGANIKSGRQFDANQINQVSLRTSSTKHSLSIPSPAKVRLFGCCSLLSQTIAPIFEDPEKTIERKSVLWMVFVPDFCDF